MPANVNKEDFRLITPIYPESYDICLQPYLLDSDGDKQFTFDGSVTIKISTHEPTKELKLHIKNLKILEKYVLKKDGTKYCDLKILNQNNVTNIWTFSLGKTLTSKSSKQIFFRFIGSMDTDMQGFYRSSYTDKDNNTK